MNMIEKVARAIATADEQNGGPPYDMLMTMGKHVREGLYDRAKAAIEAMQEPTEAMTKAGEDAVIFFVPKNADAHRRYSMIMASMVAVALEGK